MDRTTPKHPPQDLIRRSLLGDQSAFEEIFQEYKNLVYKTAYLMLGNNEDAEDILQAVFIQVYKSLGSYDPTKGAFTTWLHRITVNACLNWQRKQKFKLLSFSKQFEARTAKPSPEVQVIENLALRQALEELSIKLRAVIVLRYYWSLSYKEIAETLQIPLGTVKSRLAQALEKLGNLLRSDEILGLKEVAE